MADKNFKRRVKETVSSNTFYDEELVIPLFLKEIEDAVAKGATHISISSEYDSGCVGVSYYFLRDETDEEYKERLGRERVHEEHIRQIERAQYEALKAKLEKEWQIKEY